MIFGAELTLGIHPVPRGFGWALFEGPDNLFDWATASMPGADNGRALDRVGVLLGKYQPRALVIEEFDDNRSRRCARVRNLYRMVAVEAAANGIVVHRYSRRQIANALAIEGGFTREDVAQVVASRVQALESLLPKQRKIWESVHPRMAVFSAAACVLAHYAIQPQK
jgi:hypothetical protein